MGSVNDNIQAALSPIYGAKSTNHLIKLFREDHGLLENDRWQAYLQGTPLSDITGLSPVGSLNDIERLLFENFAELHNESTGLYLPGVAGNYVSTPGSSDFNSDDISVIIQLKDWDAGGGYRVASSWVAATSRRSWILNMSSGNTLAIQGSFDGISVSSVSAVCTDVISLSRLEYVYLAFTYQASNGSNSIVKFWESLDGLSWTQLGTDVLSFAGSLYKAVDSNSLLQIGSINGAGSDQPLKANVQLFQVYDGIGDNSAPGLGTLVAEFDASAPVGPRYRDRTGKIWTINGSAWSWE